MTAVYDAALAPFGISVAQFSELRNIRRMQPASLTDLAATLDLDRSTVGRNIKVLMRMGLVVSVEVDDRRETAVALTTKAETLLQEAAPVWAEVQDRVAERVETETLAHLLQELGKL